jgi:hypothetical protein
LTLTGQQKLRSNVQARYPKACSFILIGYSQGKIKLFIPLLIHLSPPQLHKARTFPLAPLSNQIGSTATEVGMAKRRNKQAKTAGEN